jgi:outer membrane protein OmpA-like peptidoglycan-associated protein
MPGERFEIHMKHMIGQQSRSVLLRLSTLTLLSAGLALGFVTPNARTFTAGEKAKVQGVIVSREGNVLKLRGADDSVGTVDLSADTQIRMKKSFGRKTKMDVDALVPGLSVEAQGKGNEKGELVADKVIFDPGSMRASRQIDTRLGPVEARTGTLEGRANQLEGRAGQLETRAGQIEGRQGQLEDQEKQTQQQVGQVKTTAEQANQGVSSVNQRVSDLDKYQEKMKETVYFKINSAVLSDEDKQKLDSLVQRALSEKGYLIEVAGFADTTGKAALNQVLSEKRAHAVITYLEQQGNIPIHRILTPAGMGTTHEAADNKTREGRKLNRRVEVTVLVNQGVVAGSGESGAGSPSQPSTATAPKPPGDE